MIVEAGAKVNCEALQILDRHKNSDGRWKREGCTTCVLVMNDVLIVGLVHTAVVGSIVHIVKIPGSLRWVRCQFHASTKCAYPTHQNGRLEQRIASSGVQASTPCWSRRSKGVADKRAEMEVKRLRK